MRLWVTPAVPVSVFHQPGHSHGSKSKLWFKLAQEKLIQRFCWSSSKGLMLKLQYFDHLMWRTDSGKDLDAGKDRRQEEKGMTEDETVGWHHRLNGHEFEQILGDNEGQGSLACCCPWCRKKSDMTEWLNNNLGKRKYFSTPLTSDNVNLEFPEATVCLMEKLPQTEAKDIELNSGGGEKGWAGRQWRERGKRDTDRLQGLNKSLEPWIELWLSRIPELSWYIIH